MTLSNPRQFTGHEKKEFNRLMERLRCYVTFETLLQTKMCVATTAMNDARYAGTAEEIAAAWKQVHAAEAAAFAMIAETLGDPSVTWRP